MEDGSYRDRYRSRALKKYRNYRSTHSTYIYSTISPGDQLARGNVPACGKMNTSRAVYCAVRYRATVVNVPMLRFRLVLSFVLARRLDKTTEENA